MTDIDTALDLVQHKLQVCGLASREYDATIKWDEKARLGRAKCFYKLREWRKARDAYVDVLEQFPDSKEAHTGLKQSMARLDEESKGTYDHLALYLQDRGKGQHRLDVADYIGPIGISHSTEHGRILKTTRAVKAGELLLANKAIAAVFPSDWAGSKTRKNSNLLRFVEDTPSASRLPTELTYKWIHQPQLRTTLKRLSRGPDVKQPKTFPIADMYKPKPKDEGEKPLDPSMIGRIATFAGITYDSLNYQGTGFNLINSLEIGDPCALFPYSCFTPHSCLGKAASRFIGDVHFSRATEDMPANATITINRIYDQQLHRRKRLIRELCGQDYVCLCHLCEDDEKDGEQTVNRRRRIKSNFEMEMYTQSVGTSGTFAKTKGDLEKCKDIVDIIRHTYSSARTSSVAFETLLPFMSIGYCHVRVEILTGTSTTRGAIEACKTALRRLGIVLAGDSNKTSKPPIGDIPTRSPILYLSRVFHGHATTLMSMIAGAYSSTGNDLQAKRWAQAMVWADKMVVGPSLPLFKEMNKAHIDKFDIGRYL